MKLSSEKCSKLSYEKMAEVTCHLQSSFIISVMRKKCQPHKYAGVSVSMEELSQVGWGQVMEGSVGHEKEFEMDPPGEGEPVELREDEGDVVGEWVNRRAVEFWMYWSLFRISDGEQ